MPFEDEAIRKREERDEVGAVACITSGCADRSAALVTESSGVDDLLLERAGAGYGNKLIFCCCDELKAKENHFPDTLCDLRLACATACWIQWEWRLQLLMRTRCECIPLAAIDFNSMHAKI